MLRLGGHRMIRSRSLFALSLALLATAAGLGALLVIDGEVGTDGARLAYVQEGDTVRLKGELDSFDVPEGREAGASQWNDVREELATYVYGFASTETDGAVLVTSDEPLEEGEVLVIEGMVLYSGDHPDGSGGSLVVVRVESAKEPVLFR